MSLMDSLGSSNIQYSNMGQHGINKQQAIGKIIGLIRSSNKSPKDLALQMIKNSGGNNNKQLLDFLHNCGINDDEIRNNGLNL
jgi:fatty acid-binding protein DegV